MCMFDCKLCRDVMFGRQVMQEMKGLKDIVHGYRAHVWNIMKPLIDGERLQVICVISNLDMIAELDSCMELLWVFANLSFLEFLDVLKMFMYHVVCISMPARFVWANRYWMSKRSQSWWACPGQNEATRWAAGSRESFWKVMSLFGVQGCIWIPNAAGFHSGHAQAFGSCISLSFTRSYYKTKTATQIVNQKEVIRIRADTSMISLKSNFKVTRSIESIHSVSQDVRAEELQGVVQDLRLVRKSQKFQPFRSDMRGRFHCSNQIQSIFMHVPNMFQICIYKYL